ncbi:MAG TPA: hypothetical protein VMZ31_17340 [Phycisphaerae bacterium]|nr:hypothetical protein [Phycisphaerae bacterium]
MRWGWMLAMCLACLCRPASGAKLPTKRVMLFSSGVGYFERSGAVSGADSVELRFRTEQINDILKSLLLEDLGGGKVGVVTYPAQEPLDRTLKSFAVDVTAAKTLGDLLRQLRGTEVEVLAAGESFAGRIVSVEGQKRHTGDSPGMTVEIDVLTVLTDKGLRSAALPEVRSLRVLDERIDGELRKALAALAGSRDTRTRTVVLNFAGEGERQVRAGYVIETPVWKTSYRLAMGAEGEALLQGWAIVENMTEEDWSGVELSLVSGRPISFVQDLYQPLYAPRPEVKPELYASLRPQEYGQALEELEGRARAPMAAAPPAGTSMAFRKGIRGRMAGDAVGEVSLGFVAREEYAGVGVEQVATARETGELFAYNVGVPVSIERHRSAMLPIVSQQVEVEKLSVYNPSVHAKHPLNGLMLTNNTGLNLMQGPVTVLDGGAYAGDARLGDVSPGQKRLISYALDLECLAEVQRPDRPEEVVGVRIAKGTLIVRRKYVDERVYQIKNSDAKPRVVVVEQPFDSNWKLVEPEEPFERTPEQYRFRLEVKADSTANLPVRLERYGQEHIVLADVALDRIELYIRSKQASQQLKEALQTVVNIRQQITQTQHQAADLERQLAQLDKDQDRLRQNLRAVPSNSELSGRYYQKMNEQEDQIEKFQKDLTAAREQLRKQENGLAVYLLSLDIG